MLKVVLSIIIWLGLWCIWTIELFGRTSSLLRALHWMGGLNASSKFPSWTHNTKKSPHFRSFTSIVNVTHIGDSRRHSVTHGGKSWTQPSSHHLASSILYGTGTFVNQPCWHSQPCSHVGSWPNSGKPISSWIWSRKTSEHNPSPGPFKAKGLFNSWPATQEKTETVHSCDNSHVNGQGRSHSWPASNHLRSCSQCFQLWRRWRINSSFRSRHWSQPWPSWRVHVPYHHSSGYFYTYVDTKSQSTSISHLSNSSAKSNGSTSCFTIPSLDQRRWSRAEEYETGHKVASFVEDHRCKTSSRSPGMQIEMGHPETNAWDFWPTRSWQPTPRTRGRGGGLTHSIALSRKKDVSLHVGSLNRFFSFVLFSSFLVASSSFLCLSLLPFLVFLS